jgi:hypothetical protein
VPRKRRDTEGHWPATPQADTRRRRSLCPATNIRSVPDIRLGVLLWSQATDWSSFERAAVRIDELGYDHLWTWDQCQPTRTELRPA